MIHYKSNHNSSQNIRRIVPTSVCNGARINYTSAYELHSAELYGGFHTETHFKPFFGYLQIKKYPACFLYTGGSTNLSSF